MAGSIPLSLQQVFDDEGNLLSGGLVYFIQAGTVGTPQNAFQDGGLTIPWNNPYTLLENARLPLVYFADGYIKVRITDENGVQVFNQDNIPVTGFSSGGGGGGTIDATTVLQTGQLIPLYGTGVLTGFVRANGRTMGNASSGATERANADTSALFTFLYNADANLAVSGGRGANAAADYAANKTIALPDFRGRAIAGLDDMGASAAGVVTSTTAIPNGTTLGAIAGAQTHTLTTAQLASHNHTVTDTGHVHTSGPATHFVGTANSNSAAGANSTPLNTAALSTVNTGSAVTGISLASAGSGSAHNNMQPTMLATIYLKL